MSNIEKLMSLGADCVGGDLFLRHKLLGRLRDGDIQLTDEGRAMLEVEDAVVKEEPRARRGRPRAVEPAPEVADPIDADIVFDE